MTTCIYCDHPTRDGRDEHAECIERSIVGGALKDAWRRGDYAEVTRLQGEYRALTDRPMTADERRAADALSNVPPYQRAGLRFGD